MKRLLLKLRETLGQLPDTQGRKIWICLKIRPHRFGGEGVLIGGQQQH
jgi:hypothetical protein